MFNHVTKAILTAMISGIIITLATNVIHTEQISVKVERLESDVSKQETYLKEIQQSTSIIKGILQEMKRER